MDIQATKPQIEMHLPKVGVNEVHVPVKYKRKDGGIVKLETIASMYVSLNAETKGINMSRLSRILYSYLDTDKDISLDLMESILKDYKEKLGSKDSYLKFKFNYPIRKKSLISDMSGWTYYPSVLEVQDVDDETKYTMRVAIYYSSTCPCAAHLGDLLRQRIVVRDGQEISIDQLPREEQAHYANCTHGVPHAQRSRADIAIRFTKENPVWIEDVVSAIEAAIKVPVQVLVRREDEQEFSKLSAENPMFVEDAVRFMSETLDILPGVLDFSVVANHFENLHMSNAVAVNWKGIPGGLR